MSLPRQIGAYNDCFKLWDLGVSDPAGARACLGTYAKAKHFSMRMHMSRQLLRDETRGMFEEGHPQYNKSEYDKFKVNLEKDSAGEWWVYVREHGMDILALEGLSEL